MKHLEPSRNGAESEFWRLAEESILALPYCDACGTYWELGAIVCPDCLADLTWRECSGEAVVESWVIYRRGYAAALEDEVPYYVASLRTAEGPRMTASLVGELLDRNASLGGRTARVEWERSIDGAAVPVFRIV